MMNPSKTTIPVIIPEVKTHCQINNIAFYGSADVDSKHPLYIEAENIAKRLATEGKTIVNGGGPGVMQAATEGAEAVGGETLVVTFYPKDAPEFEGRFESNHADKEIVTANYIERMFGLMDNADAFICFQGGTGTLSEWATAWLLAHIYHGKHKPIILYGQFWHELMDVVNEHFFIGEKEKEVYKIVTNPDELLVALAEFEQELETRCGLPQPNQDLDEDEDAVTKGAIA